MKNIEKNYPNKNCGESCGCKIEAASADAKKSPIAGELEAKSQNKNSAQEAQKPALDPVHFGDWQVNCRAIDF